MPLSVMPFSEGVPSWIVIGIVLVGGWMFERGTSDENRITTLEANQAVLLQTQGEHTAKLDMLIKHFIEGVPDERQSN